MKNKIRFLAMMLIGVLLSVNQVWGGSYSLSGSEFGTSNVSSYAAGPATLTGADGGKWTVAGYGVTANTNVIIGKGGANYLQTPECSGNITSVVVTWSGNTSYYLALQTTSGTELEAKKNPTNATEATFTISSGEYKQLRLVGRRSSGTSNAAATITAVTVNYSSGGSKKTVNYSGQKSGHFQPSFLALSQIVIWGFFAFFCKKVFHIRCTKGAYRMHVGSLPSSQPLFSPFGTLFAIAPTWLIPNWLIGYPP